MNIEIFLSKLGISNHPGLRVDPRLQGYRNYTFGCSAGPTDPNIDDLSHELAHAIQFGSENFEERNCEGSFVFNLPEKYVCGQMVHEPETTQITERELETFAIQLKLLEHACAAVSEDWIDEHVELIYWLQDFYEVPGKTKEEKFAWAKEKLLEFYAPLKIENLLEELNGWLDQTAKVVL